MLNWKTLFGRKNDAPSRGIKKEIKYKNLIIKLYDYKFDDPVKEESNIEACDLEGQFLWRAENCRAGRYYEMQIDDVEDNLYARDGSAMHYTIELKNGTILTEKFIK
ncbi:MAG: hypothetical protein ABI581_02085 [Sediminibacterium sp.]